MNWLTIAAIVVLATYLIGFSWAAWRVWHNWGRLNQSIDELSPRFKKHEESWMRPTALFMVCVLWPIAGLPPKNGVF